MRPQPSVQQGTGSPEATEQRDRGCRRGLCRVVGGLRGGGEFAAGAGRTSRSHSVGKSGRALWADGRVCRELGQHKVASQQDRQGTLRAQQGAIMVMCRGGLRAACITALASVWFLRPLPKGTYSRDSC